MNELLKIAPNILIALLLLFLLIKSNKTANKENNVYYILGILISLIFIVLELFYFT